MTRLIKITDRGVDAVEQHLSRFRDKKGNTFAANDIMIRELRKIARGEMEPTQIHKDFYAHELREMVRLRHMGSVSGRPNPSRYLNAQYATLLEYRIPVEEHVKNLYTELRVNS
ncbi:MAG: hypothetical protein AAF483_11205 [Planctomycetota bacterium]